MKVQDYLPTVDEENKVKLTLELLRPIFSGLDEKYRVWGSLLAAAVVEKLHRKIRDVDLLIDADKLGRFLTDLEKAGFNINKKSLSFLGLGMDVYIAERKDCINLNFFIGKFFENRDFEIKLSKNFSVATPAKAIVPTRYSLYGVNFVGVPATTNYARMYASRGNPKRKYDLEIMKDIKKDPEILKMDLIQIRYKGKQLTWLFNLLQFLENILGGIRVKLGLPFEVWE